MPKSNANAPLGQQSDARPATNRRKLVVANWKMNGDRAMCAELCAAIVDGAQQTAGQSAQSSQSSKIEIVLCPPHILIPPAVDALEGSGIAVGAQDLDANANGAFSGQVSASMVVDSGCRYTIVGHSERRTLYGESNALVAQKTKSALAAGLRAIVCLGETASERQSGQTEQVITQQLDAVMEALGEADLSNVVLAYEPVWAIGSGVTATPVEAQQVHHFLRARLATHDLHIAQKCRILYGGSMKPQNAAQLIAQTDIDGGLIGGAALNATDFLAICKSVAAT